MNKRYLKPWLLIFAIMAILVAACGDGDSEGTDEPTTTAQSEDTTGSTEAPATTAAPEEATTTQAEPTTLRVLFPINTPILHGFRVAEQAGYYADEGIDVEFQFLGGGGEVVTQLLAENGDLGIIPVGNVVEAIEQGNTDLRAIWNYVYGSIFYIAVPADSDIQTAADLDGKKVGISDLSGGEVPIVRGIIESAGLSSEEDVELVPIGEGTALTVRALEEGQVDAFGGSINDIIALQVQGLDLRYILPDELLELPASGVVANQSLLDTQADAVTRFLRATTKGTYWGQVNPDASLCILKEVTPEQFAEETGDLIFEAVLPITWAPEGEKMGYQSAETWGTFFDFIGADRPDVDLSEIVTDAYIDDANDFDMGAVEDDANAYPSC